MRHERYGLSKFRGAPDAELCRLHDNTPILFISPSCARPGVIRKVVSSLGGWAPKRRSTGENLHACKSSRLGIIVTRGYHRAYACDKYRLGILPRHLRDAC